MLKSVGFCSGIENYSRHLSGRLAGAKPSCLIDYFPKDFLLVIDESHVTVPQLRGMYEGDRSRKQTLVDFGFRLPSALDNRPLKFSETESLVNQAIYISATPGPYELSLSGKEVVEQIVRPTGLVDPQVEIHPVKNQIEHLIGAAVAAIKDKQRILVTTLTKRTAEDLAEYLAKKNLSVCYLHCDIEALERVKILRNLRLGNFDVLVGVNLLREGLDIPEVALVAILDADKEGFLRSETSLIQTCGRAARNIKGRVILYADQATGSMQRALDEMSRRRDCQLRYNSQHKITPKSIIKEVRHLTEFETQAKQEGLAFVYREIEKVQENKSRVQVLRELEIQMKEAADRLDFESAAFFRDQIVEFRSMLVKDASRV